MEKINNALTTIFSVVICSFLISIAVAALNQIGV